VYNTQIKAFVDDIPLLNGNYNPIINIQGYFGLRADNPNANGVLFDNFRVRKYAFPEPTVLVEKSLERRQCP